jgi:hypothetical protein
VKFQVGKEWPLDCGAQALPHHVSIILTEFCE